MRDYFVYLPQQPPGNIWGCTATSVGFARVSRTRSIRRLGIRRTTILNGPADGSSNGIKSFSSPKAQASSKASTRASRGSSNPAQCSSCFLAFGTVMPPIPLWAGRNTGSSAKARLLMRPFAPESWSRPSRYCTQGWSLICCGASSAAMRLRLVAHSRTSTSSQRWACTCSP